MCIRMHIIHIHMDMSVLARRKNQHKIAAEIGSENNYPRLPVCLEKVTLHQKTCACECV